MSLSQHNISLVIGPAGTQTRDLRLTDLSALY